MRLFEIGVFCVGILLVACFAIIPWLMAHEICVEQRKTIDPFYLCGAPYSQLLEAENK